MTGTVCRFVWRLLVVSYAAVFILLAVLPIQAQSTATTEALQMQSMHLLTANTGWVAGKNHLLRTTDTGQHWTEITPPGKGTGSIQSVFFLDTLRGWVVSSSSETKNQSAGSLIVSSTSNGGLTWTSRTAVPEEEGSTAISIDFVDARNGWIVLRLPSSSNFSRGALLATSDGGVTWNSLPQPPISDAIRFISPSTGWIAGGVAGDQLYVTRDGGYHWQQQSLPPDASGEKASAQTYQLPVFNNSRDGALAVISSKAGESVIVVYNTHDGGMTWSIRRTLPVGEDTSKAVVSVVNADTLFVAPANRIGLTAVAQGEQSVHEQFFSRLLPSEAVTRLDFKNDHQGWALVAGGTCDNWKSQCRQESKLFATSDGGQTTTDITPSVASTSTSSVVTPDAVANSTGKGFDKCSAGTVSQMQAWWTNTPWSYANIYMGGSNRGCSQPTLTSGWVSSIFAQGWQLIPTWVGPQAPGSSCTSCGLMSSNTTTAAQQGTSEANSAASAASALGLNAPTVIYYDMERYDPTSSAAAQAFVNAWVVRLHQLGDKAGVYGSGANAASDWATIANPPDAVWIANWNGSTSVYGLSGLPDSYWVNHQRIHQYEGGHNETWGGVTFNIDSDSADGPVADN